MSSSYSDATRCPECDTPGEVRVKRPAPPQAGLPRGTEVHMTYCVNKKCSWYNTPWMVQVNPDGTVPDKKDHTGEPKVYQGFEGHDEQAQRLINQITLQNEMTKKPGGIEFFRRNY